jgi:hypothetical protein
MTHSHFALMGGFAFEKTASGVNILPNDRPSVTLTSHALRKLAAHEPDMIPDISAETIKSKSKADWGARAWVTAQCLRFIFKVFARLLMNYPITVLELTTFIQVLYCLVFFTAWSKKPLDVTVPHFIQVDTDLKRQMCAWMVMNSTLGTNKSIKEEEKNNQQRLPTPISEPSQEMDRTEETNSDQGALRDNPATNEEDTSKIRIGETIHGFKLDPKGDYDNYISSSKSDGECVRRASSLQNRSQAASKWKISRREDIAAEKKMLVTHISAISPPKDEKVAQFHDIKCFNLRGVGPAFVRRCGTFVAGSVFGLAHLLALNAPFSSQKHGRLWLASCIVTSSPLGILLLYCPLYCLYALLSKKVRVQNCPMNRSLRKLRRSDLNMTLWNGVDIAGILSFLIQLAYPMLVMVCRVYLLVGCILNLTHLPAEVYQKPKWMQWLP